MSVNPWVEGPSTPYWRTEYWGPDNKQYQFCSFAETMAQHLYWFHDSPDVPKGSFPIRTGMVWNRRGQLVWS